MNLFSQLLKRLNLKKGHRTAFGLSPEVDWKIIFVSTAVLIILVIASSIFIYVKIDKGEIFVVEKPEENRERTLNISALKETISYYQNKALEFERIKSQVTPATDPSL